MRNSLVPAVALLLSLLSACAGPPREGCGLTASRELPLSPLGPFRGVPSTINGVPALLVVDTGAGHTVISDGTARRAGVVPDLQRLVRSTGIGGTSVFPTGQVERMSLGGVPVLRPVVTIMPGVPIADGNLGMDILGDADLDIDMPAGRLTLHHGRLCPDEAPPWTARATELETVAQEPRAASPAARPRLLLAVMELDGRQALAMLDTGAGRSVVSRAFVGRLGVDAAALAQRPGVVIAGLSTETGEGRIWQFGQARIGSDILPAPALVVADLHGAAFDVLLGMDYLGQRRVWISYGARRILVARP
ncbi:conserved exported protein of unknown function [Rhodovastum atsumiense]|uniref:Peptidase A2 domain-containing protein n=1 Tax=Rhodovastum atsumiense TaxID=504468 RepID=A0A5M6IPZ6_9PROT|nr:retroviral-like aspartic protease family protein [Rhodovastum atsumiense]KAA5609555.1 hypothetical protein F1189_23775 [Rhodovastum atsumiense]CAH2604912.1 conserved exported protein of unknown function [Rhodovastum atsumiense]